MPSLNRSEAEAVSRQFVAIRVAIQARIEAGKANRDTPEHTTFRHRLKSRLLEVMIEEGVKYNARHPDRITHGDYAEALGDLVERFSAK